MLTTSQRRLYAVALLSLPVLSELESWFTYVAQGGADAPDSEVGSPAMLAPIAAHQGLWLAGAFIGMLFAVLQLPAVLAMIRLARPRTTRLTATAAVLALPGVVVYGGYVVTWNFVIGAMASSAAAPDALARLAHDLEHYPAFILIFANAYPLNLGLLLLAIALGRARVVPWWAAACVAASPVNELVGIGDGWVYLFVNLLWLVGLTWVAANLLRTGSGPASAPTAGTDPGQPVLDAARSR
jgi:Domain of unknown function (DUF4386)